MTSSPPPPAPVPTRIGPYHVVTRLASGGMAEIFLAVRRCISGFEKPVVVKRMLPHVAADPEIRGSLIDEARLVARLRHPNVVSIDELGKDGETFYLVLEYLRGDSLSALARRLRVRGERLDPALVAFIVSEICAGLHAAHELTDEDGALLGVVHRDVSPHNVLLTFDGEVKVIDFGIARFNRRSASHTRTGMAKGKLAYMAPEQFTGEVMDRRADVFAIGTLMHELLSGERLFARESDMQILKAILNDPIVPPSQRWPAIPASIDAVCLRALARSPDDRYPTAEALRAAVHELMPVLDPGQHARQRLVELMRRVLADRWAESEALLRRSHERSATRPNPARTSGDHVAVVQVRPAALAGAGTPSRPSPEALPEIEVAPFSEPEIQVVTQGLTPLPRAREPGGAARRPAMLLGGLGAIGLAAVAIVSLWPRTPPPETTISGPTLALPPAPIAAIDAAPPPLPQPAPPAIPEPPTTVRVHVETAPAGAAVTVAGHLLGVTPCEIELARGASAVELTLARPGYTPASETIVPSADARVRVHLVRVREPARPRRGPHFYSFDDPAAGAARSRAPGEPAGSPPRP